MNLPGCTDAGVTRQYRRVVTAANGQIADRKFLVGEQRLPRILALDQANRGNIGEPIDIDAPITAEIRGAGIAHRTREMWRTRVHSVEHPGDALANLQPSAQDHRHERESLIEPDAAKQDGK